MASLGEIEALTKTFADARRDLECEVAALEGEIAEMKRKRMPVIRTLVGTARGAQDQLHTALAGSPECFQKPKSLVLHGIKVGFKKAPGKLEIANENGTIKLIRKHLPDRVDALIQTTEAVVKAGLNQLTAQQLKQIGVTVIDAGDEPFIKPEDGGVEKIVNALLKDEAKDAEQKEPA